MATEIKLPQLGENLSGGDVLDVKVAPGDTVSPGQTLLEVEAEKSTVEVPSHLGGRVQQMLVKKGDAITVGQVLAVVDEAETGAAEAAKTPPAKSANGNRGVEAPARVKEQQAPTGDGQRQEKPKGASEAGEKPSAPPAPVAREKPSALPPSPSPPKPPEKAAPEKHLVAAGPATRRLARELGVDLARVQGTAPGGRVTPEDVKSFVRGLATAGAGRARGVQEPALPDFSRWGQVERQPLDGIRRKTAEQMSLAWSVIPHVTQHDVADVTDLEAFRKAQEVRGPKLTITAFALKAAAIAL